MGRYWDLLGNIGRICIILFYCAVSDGSSFGATLCIVLFLYGVWYFVAEMYAAIRTAVRGQ